ncbi:MAG TPA: GNAT family N-acetyltransferase [Arachidicoccus soli]|nr:GNAT family N-acetyltransferase [Arachidicoccus soli]
MREIYQQLTLRNNVENQRFELEVENKTAFLEYKIEGNKYLLIHTEVPETLEGKGVAAALVEKVFIFIEESKFKFIPLCPYVLSYLKKHPEWLRLTN